MFPRSRRAGKTARAVLGFAGIGAAVTLGVVVWRCAREELAIAALGSPDAGVRSTAARKLADWGTVRAIPALLDCERPEDLQNDLSRVQDCESAQPSYAFEALGRLVSQKAVSCLLKLVESPLPANRLWAARALGKFRTHGDRAFDAIRRMLDDPQHEVAESAAHSLLRFGSRAVPDILAAIESSARWGDAAAEAESRLWESFVQLGPLARGVIPRIVHRLLEKRDSYAEFNEGYVEYLEPQIWKIAGKELEKRLKDASHEEKAQLAACISDWAISISPTEATRDIVPALRWLANEPEEELKETASQALEWAQSRARTADSEGGSDSRSALAEDFEALRGTDTEAHQRAAYHLAFFEPSSGDKELLGPFLAPFLSDSSAAVRSSAAWCLAKLGAAVRGAIPQLKSAIDDKHLAVRIFAADALSKFGQARERTEKVLEASLPEALALSNELLVASTLSGLVRLRINDSIGLRSLLLDERKEVSRAAWRALQELGQEAAPALPLLIELWDGHASDVLDVIRDLGPAAFSVAPKIEALVVSQSPLDRLDTLQVLNAVAPGAKCARLLAETFSEAKGLASLRQSCADELLESARHAQAEIPRFLRHLRENDGAVYASAILSRMGAPAVPALLEALRDQDADFRTWAAWTLGGMAPVPAEAKPSLTQAMEDPSDLVRSAAAQALERAAFKDKSLPSRDWPRGTPFECGNPYWERAEEFHLAISSEHRESKK